MSREIRCPDCTRTWQVENAEDGELLCPYCMSRIPLEVPASAPAPAPTPQAHVPAASPVVASAQPTTEVCPRCNLHFQPRGRTVQREKPRKTALVVDDLEYFRQIAKDALESFCQVKTAASSSQAREALSRGGIDLLVLDLTLEGSGAGHRFLSELGPKPCPILIYTAQDESEMYGEMWEKLQELGADDLVIKGMQVAESLARKASALLGVPMDDGDAIR